MRSWVMFASCLVLLATTTTTCCDALSTRLYGINYSLTIAPDWANPRCKTRDQVKADLAQLKNQVTDNVRVYSVADCDTASILLSVTAELGMNVWLGLWVGNKTMGFDNERARLLELLNSGDFDFANVLGIHVSSEAIYRGEITVQEAISLRNIIKADLDAVQLTKIPVTVADIIDTSISYSTLTTLDESVVTFNQFPFWERTVDINSAAQYMSDRVKLVEDIAGGRQIIVTETGWADAGSNGDANVADPASMAKWMSDFVCLANQRKWQYFWFDAYDSGWRRIMDKLPNDVEGHFGIFHENGTMKASIRDLVIDCSDGQGNDEPTVSPAAVEIPSASPVKSTPNATKVPAATSTNMPVESPSAKPSTATTTNMPVESPSTKPSAPPVTLSPVALPNNITNSTASPVKAPRTPAPTAMSPSPPPPATAETIGPSKAPVPAPPTGAPFLASARPSGLPTTYNAPTMKMNASDCQLHNACAARNLTGQCCPTTDDWTLTCCGPPVESACANNGKCAAIGVTGTCCPTPDDKYLDCCDVVPDECQSVGASCERYSAARYKRAQDVAAANGAKSASAAARSSHGSDSSSWIMLAISGATALLFAVCAV